MVLNARICDVLTPEGIPSILSILFTYHTAMIKIYGSAQSSAARSIWMLEELEIPYEQQSLNFKEKEHKAEWYLKLNPNGKVPTLTDGEFVLWESCAINDYLAEKYRPEMLGSTLEERALVAQWTYWSLLHLQRNIDPILYFMMFKMGTEEAANQGRLDVVRYLEVLNVSLAGKDHIVGSTFTVADLNLASIIHMAMQVQVDLASYGNIITWFEKIKTRPSFGKLLQKMQG
jgi:glutathione S-transferase